ncbi:hypothetical protein QAD02_018176 [Eretmocerus hayati]|uniref:Uncharacterized protein n=1 Tax=Eretmocerus hayati TaxID=131215 RepID=A0ACC2PIH6_9HYME|nr:hypothetical protein QAD02_018176 [Eretmocerus hayati]
MAPLSRELAGVILPHDHFGSHMDGSKRTIDEDLELKNFESAGQTLAQIWSDVSIDDHPGVAVYADENSVADDTEEIDMDWYDVHVRESQYLLQIAKCNDRDCCGDLRSSLKDILPLSDGFLPPPFPLRRKECGILGIPTPADTNPNDSVHDLSLRQSIGLRPCTTTGSPVPYDYYCPSIRDQITGRLCRICGAYFGSKKRKELHSKHKHGSECNSKLRATRILSKRGNEVLCEIDALEPIVEWVEPEDLDGVQSFFLVLHGSGFDALNASPEWISSLHVGGTRPHS